MTMPLKNLKIHITNVNAFGKIIISTAPIQMSLEYRKKPTNQFCLECVTFLTVRLIINPSAVRPPARDMVRYKSFMSDCPF